MEELFIGLNKSSDIPLYEQIYLQIREDIINGKLTVGTKLPSKRKLSDFLKISQTTVELAYGQLVAEGFIISKPRTGFFVQAIEELAYVEPTTSHRKHKKDNKQSILYDFSHGQIDIHSFPFSQWRKCAKELLDDSSRHLLTLGHPHGDIELRQEIAHYLYHSRGVECTPDQIIIGSGTEQLLPLLIRILGSSAIYAFEDPGYPLTHHVFIHNHRQAIPIPVDDEGIDVQALQQSPANVAYVTPSHQFPTGTVLSAARRTALLNWATSNEQHFIIEDDYDSEFRYTGRPIPSLQGMDRAGNVIYVSTFSKSLMPSLRIAYMVLPPLLLHRYTEAFTHYASTVPRFDQQTLAKFMAEGHFAKHLNRMRKLYKRKVQLLTETLSYYQQHVSFSGADAGMHILLQLAVKEDEEKLKRDARQHHLIVHSLSEYSRHSKNKFPAFVIGFGGLSEEQIPHAVHTLMTAWNIKKG